MGRGENERKLWAFYTRVSTRLQHLENQSSILESYRLSKSIPWSEIVTFSDVGSGRSASRSGYEALLTKVCEGKIKEIVLPDLTRAWRDWEQFGKFLKLLEKHEVTLVSLRENINSSTVMGRALMLMVSVLGQMEREILVERTLSGLERARREGKILGRPKNSKDKRKRKKLGYFLRYQPKNSPF